MYKESCRLRSMKKELRIAQTIFDCSTRQIERIASQEDPVMRYRLPVELFRISNDLMTTMSKIFFETYTEDTIEDIMEAKREDEAPEISEKRNQGILELQLLLENLLGSISNLQRRMEEFGEQFSHYISIPQYAPNELLGKEIMTDANEEFESLME